MRKRASVFIGLFICVLGFALTGCVSSDRETEQKLAGTWQTSFSESEDGVQITGTLTETYSLEDHKYNGVIRYSFGYPVSAHFATISYSGSWKASKKIVEVNIDKESVDFSFNKSITDWSDREEFKQEILLELKKNSYCEGMRFTSEITDTFEAEDDDGEKYTYSRIN